MSSATVTFGIVVLGVVLILAFTVVGLVSRRFRKRLQVPADEMLERDRERWGGHEPTKSPGEEENR
ncbi:hypothetical protein O9K63_03085 [Janibacter cremeus]|uniref:hypothetical protein n=1 Tax=Janibacter cremeus TaxID=1285192 RepID=UPI0023F769E2|nr:hypothetical protein [Janibacter cremeus]WEV78795.1 hypothetical protein O9K63_03085 [Janibacter cremeus]